MSRKGGLFKLYKLSKEMTKFTNKEYANHSELVRDVYH